MKMTGQSASNLSNVEFSAARGTSLMSLDRQRWRLWTFLRRWRMVLSISTGATALSSAIAAIATSILRRLKEKSYQARSAA
jgi:hypothetical protein